MLKAKDLIVSVTLSVTLLFFAFGAVPSIFALPPEQPPESVTLQLKWFHQFQFAGYYAAKEMGFYAEEGLDVSIRERERAKSHIQAVVDGETQYGVADAGLLLDRMQDQPVVLLKQIFQHSPLAFITLEKSGLKTPFDLRGKRIMLDRRGNSDAPLLAMLLNTIGDLEQVEFVSHSFNLDDLVHGKVDASSAYTTSQPFLLRQQGMPVNIIDPRSYGIDIYGDNLFTTEAEIRDHPQRVEKMIRASLKGWRYALDHPEEVSALILKKYAPQSNPAQLAFEARETARMIDPGRVPLGTVVPARYEAIASIYAQAGLVTDPGDWSGIFYQQEFPHVSRGIGPAIGLSRDEIAWLKQHPTIRIGVDADYAPYSFRDDQGRYRGIAMEFGAYLSKQLGIAMEVVPGLSWPQIVDGVRERSLDVVMTMFHRPEREAFVNFTESYLPSPLVIMVRSGETRIRSETDLDGSRVALVEGYHSAKRVLEEHPGVIPLKVKTAEEGLFAVATGKADAYVGVLGINLYLAKEKGITNLEVVALYGEGTFAQRFGVRKDWPQLATILDKALAAMPEADRRQLFERWLPAQVFFSVVQETPTITLTDKEKAWIEAHPKIVLGTDAKWRPFVTMDDDGTLGGIEADLLTRINRLAGTHMEIVLGQWSEMVDKAKRREIDGLAVSAYHKEREPHFLFTDSPYSVVKFIYTNRYLLPELKDMQSLTGKRVALLRGNRLEQKLLEKQPGITAVAADNNDEMIAMLATGQVDAVIGGISFRLAARERLIATTDIDIALIVPDSETKILYSIRKDWPELHAIINKALAAIPLHERLAILEKWGVPRETKAEIPSIRQQLTAEEQAWLAEHPVIRLGVDPFYPPFEFVDETDRYRGIAAEYLEIIGERLGVTFERAPGLTWTQVLEGVQKDTVDLLPVVTDIPERRAFLNFTAPYLAFPDAIVMLNKAEPIANMGDLGDKAVAIPRGYSDAQVLAKQYPSINILLVETPLDGLKAVAVGEAKATYGSLPVLSYLMLENHFNNLKVAALDDDSFSEHSMGVRKDWPEFVPILKKALASIDRKEIQAIRSRWIGTQWADRKRVIALTAEEKAWLKAHPRIRVSNEPDYAPFDFQIEGKPAGYSIDYVKLLAERLGIEVEFVQDSWANLLEKAKRREVDLLHSIFKSPKEREEYLNFTTPYKKTLNAIITRWQTTDIRSLDDLAGRSVALVAGDSTGQLIREQFPEIRVVEVEDYEAALKAVAFGRAEATMTELPVASYLIRSLALTNLMVAAEVEQIGEREQKYRLAVRKDWPQLIPILEKAMESLTPDELLALDNRWLALPAESAWSVELPETADFKQVDFVLKWLAGIFAVICVLVLAAWMLRGRPRQLSIRETHFLVSLVFTGLILAIGILMILLGEGAKEQVEIEERKFRAISLAFELKQSSDDLTRLARTYVVTADSRYEAFFWVISAIRDGRQPHPANYTRAYWDRVTAGEVVLDEKGETYSIEQRIIELGLTEDEQQRLVLAKQESDALIALETVAMNAVKGIFADEDGDFTVAGEPDLEVARRLMHGQEYHDAKGRIMRPIDEFFLLLEARTTNELNLIRGRNNAIIVVVTLLAIVTIIGAGYIVFVLTRKVINPLLALESTVIRIGAGERDLQVNIREKNEIGRLGAAFNRMQAERNNYELELERSNEQTRQALQETAVQEQRFRSLVGNIAGAVYRGALDEHWTIHYFSDYTEQITGYPASDFINNQVRTYASIIHPDDRGIVTQAVMDGLASDGYYTIEYRIIDKEGQIHWIFEKGQVIWNEAGEVEYLDGVIMDNSDRKRYELELNRAKIVAEAANKKLQELDSLKSMFIASMSHELRTPLNSIISFSGILQRELLGDLNEGQHDSLKRVERAARHLLSLISDVIDISKIEAGRIDTYAEDFPLKELVDEALDIIRLQAEAKGLALAVEAASWPVLHTDRRRLLQCLVNLLSNAVKFSEQGEITVLVSDHDEALEIAVRDTGIGIAEEDLPKLFEAFERLETHLRVKAGGTGLGLYLTRKIATDLLGGKVSVESRLGEGSTFRLAIPKIIATTNTHAEGETV